MPGLIQDKGVFCVEAHIFIFTSDSVKPLVYSPAIGKWGWCSVLVVKLMT